MRYIIYCRKSTESEDRQVQSLDAQKTELLKMAERDNLKVVKIFEESQSAKSLGRPIFAQMMKMFATGKADAVLCWKTDRLARNLIDGGLVMDYLQKFIIKEIRTFEGVHLPKDNVLMLAVQFGMANQFSRDLAENVKRGNRESLRQGKWPFQVPFGYKRNPADKSLFVDEDRAYWIKRMFNLYSSGTKSFEDISDMLFEEGLRTKSGKKLYLGSIHRLVLNKFYFGIMEKDGIAYIGKHEPIVSKELFDRCQEVIHQASRPKQKTLFFPLRGPMRCQECGCMLTASLKKGYRYYYCTNGKGSCEQGKAYMREEYITQLIADKLGDLAFDDEAIEIMYEAAKQKIGTGNRAEVVVSGIKKELGLLDEKESRLADAMASGSLKIGLYDDKVRELNNQRVELESQMSLVKKDNPESALATLERTKGLFLQAKNAKKDFLTGEDSKRHQILNSLLWNALFLNKEIQEIQYKKPFLRIANTPKNADFSVLSAQ